MTILILSGDYGYINQHKRFCSSPHVPLVNTGDVNTSEPPVPLEAPIRPIGALYSTACIKEPHAYPSTAALSIGLITDYVIIRYDIVSKLYNNFYKL